MGYFRVYVDGIFDLLHEGHVRLFKKAIAAAKEEAGGREVKLLVGVCSSGAAGYKRAPIMTSEEREEAVRVQKIVDVMIPDAPMSGPDEAFIIKHGIDLVIHGDDFSEQKIEKYYGIARREGKFKTVPYEEGVSTSMLLREAKERGEFSASTKATLLERAEIITRIVSRSWGELGFASPERSYRGGEALPAADCERPLCALLAGAPASFYVGSLLADGKIFGKRGDDGRSFERDCLIEAHTFFEDLLLAIGGGDDKAASALSLLSRSRHCEEAFQKVSSIDHLPDRGKESLRLADGIAKDIGALKEGESLLLPTGWHGLKSSHTALLLLKREEGESFSLALLSTGELNGMHRHRLRHAKVRVERGIFFEKVPSKLLLESGFIRSLVELKENGHFSKRVYRSGDYAKKEFYNLFTRFQGYRSSSRNPTYRSLQKSQNSPFRAILAFLQEWFGEERYEELRLKIDEKVVGVALEQNRELLPKLPMLREVLLYGARAAARRLLDRQKREMRRSGGALNEGRLRDLRRRASLLEGAAALLTTAGEGEGSSPAPFLGIGPLRSQSQALRELLKKLQEARPHLEVSHGRGAPLTPATRLPADIFPTPHLPKELSAALAGVREAAVNWKKGGRVTLATAAVHKALFDLPMPAKERSGDAVWNLFTAEEAKGAIEELLKLCRLLHYLRAAESGSLRGKKGEMPPENCLAIHKAIACCYRLIQVIEEGEGGGEKVGGCALSPQALIDLNESFHALFFSPELYRESERLIDFFTHTSSGVDSRETCLFAFHSWDLEAPRSTLVPEDSVDWRYLSALTEGSAFDKVDDLYERLQRQNTLFKEFVAKRNFTIDTLWEGYKKFIPSGLYDKLYSFYALQELFLLNRRFEKVNEYFSVGCYSTESPLDSRFHLSLQWETKKLVFEREVEERPVLETYISLSSSTTNFSLAPPRSGAASYSAPEKLWRGKGGKTVNDIYAKQTIDRSLSIDRLAYRLLYTMLHEPSMAVHQARELLERGFPSEEPDCAIWDKLRPLPAGEAGEGVSEPSRTDWTAPFDHR